jgi:SAM-dependent methyltransferase
MRKYVGWIAVGLVLVSVGVYGCLASPWQSARSSKASDTLYDSSFFEALSSGSASSAAQILPEVVRLIAPKSAVDLGSGTGEWLGELRKLGVTDVLGVNGDWVNPAALKIPTDQFRPFDLRNKFAMDRAFDLAISVETAEHLPPERGGVCRRPCCPGSRRSILSCDSRPGRYGPHQRTMARLLGSPFCETRLCRSGLSAAKILERFTNRMVVPSEHHSLRPARSRRGRSETSVPCLIAAARCDSFPPELSHGHSNAGDCCCGRRRSSSDPPSSFDGGRRGSRK